MIFGRLSFRTDQLRATAEVARQAGSVNSLRETVSPSYSTRVSLQTHSGGHRTRTCVYLQHAEHYRVLGLGLRSTVNSVRTATQLRTRRYTRLLSLDSRYLLTY